MQARNYLFVVLLAFAALLWSCGEANKGPSQPSGNINELIQQGWAAFIARDYGTAIARFNEAKSLDAARTEVYTGLGWSHLKADDLDASQREFDSGSRRQSPSADLFAGWAFVLNALKNYSSSNLQINRVLSQASSWSFTHDTGLDVNDLRVLKAENHFLLGQFRDSLAEVQALNAGFTADVQTSDGLATLATEIERLKGVYSN